MGMAPLCVPNAPLHPTSYMFGTVTVATAQQVKATDVLVGQGSRFHVHKEILSVFCACNCVCV
jgi:hypothetical protein